MMIIQCPSFEKLPNNATVRVQPATIDEVVASLRDPDMVVYVPELDINSNDEHQKYRRVIAEFLQLHQEKRRKGIVEEIFVEIDLDVGSTGFYPIISWHQFRSTIQQWVKFTVT
jgi:hypothetical protein